MNNEKEFEPFGEEWLIEMKKWNKAMLIDLLRTTLMKNVENKHLPTDTITLAISALELNNKSLGITLSIDLLSVEFRELLQAQFEQNTEIINQLTTQLNALKGN